MKFTSLLVLSSLLYSSMAINQSIKKQLGQISQNNLIELEAEQYSNCTLPYMAPPSLDFCNCNVTATVPPPAGSANYQTFQQTANVAQGQVVTQTPNTASLTTCQGQCCSCAAQNEVAVEQEIKTRKFCINGNIIVEEQVCTQSVSEQQEQSLSQNQKVSNCILVNQNGGSSGAPNNGTVCVNLA